LAIMWSPFDLVTSTPPRCF